MPPDVAQALRVGVHLCAEFVECHQRHLEAGTEY